MPQGKTYGAKCITYNPQDTCKHKSNHRKISSPGTDRHFSPKISILRVSVIYKPAIARKTNVPRPTVIMTELAAIDHWTISKGIPFIKRSKTHSIAAKPESHRCMLKSQTCVTSCTGIGNEKPQRCELWGFVLSGRLLFSKAVVELYKSVQLSGELITFFRHL